MTVGSATKVSEQQLVYLIDRLKIKPVIPNIKKLASFGGAWHDEIDKAVKKAKRRMDKNEVTVITTNEENLVLIDIKQIAADNDVTPDRVAQELQTDLQLLQNDSLMSQVMTLKVVMSVVVM